MGLVCEVAEVVSVRHTVERHYQFLSEAPEKFAWERVINPKIATVAQMIASDVKDRQAEWTVSGRSGVDPAVEGLREALRIIARTAIWCVQSEQRAASMEASRLGLNHARPLPANRQRAA